MRNDNTFNNTQAGCQFSANLNSVNEANPAGSDGTSYHCTCAANSCKCCVIQLLHFLAYQCGDPSRFSADCKAVFERHYLVARH